MKIILLDLDGVMIPIKYGKSPNILEDGFPEFSYNSVNKLNSIIDNSTIIYLTTSHKDNYSLIDWVNIFKRRGININKIDRIKSTNKSRKDDILSFVSKTKVNYLIIDDDNSLEDLPIDIKKNWIKTYPMIGLK